jgi:hypothetical protein
MDILDVALGLVLYCVFIALFIGESKVKKGVRSPREESLFYKVMAIELVHTSIQFFCSFSLIPIFEESLPYFLHDQML